MSKNLIISSYLPFYRSPPSPKDLIDWDFTELCVFANPVNTDPQIIRSIAKRYLIDHPDMLHVNETEYKIGYANQLILRLKARLRSRIANSKVAITGCMVDAIMPPDNMLDFEYALVSFRIDPDKMLALVRTYIEDFVRFIDRRLVNKKYLYLREKKLRKLAYWIDVKNWTGFSAGLILDWYMSSLLPLNLRRFVWRLPICLTESSQLSDAITIDETFAQLFSCSHRFLQLLVNLCATRHYSVYGILRNPLPEDVTSMIDSALTNLEEENVQPQSTERREGTILQAGTGISLGTDPTAPANTEFLRAYLNAPATIGIVRDAGTILHGENRRPSYGGGGIASEPGLEQLAHAIEVQRRVEEELRRPPEPIIFAADDDTLRAYPIEGEAEGTAEQ